MNKLYRLNTYKWTPRNYPTYLATTKYCFLKLATWLKHGYIFVALLLVFVATGILWSQVKYFKCCFFGMGGGKRLCQGKKARGYREIPPPSVPLLEPTGASSVWAGGRAQTLRTGLWIQRGRSWSTQGAVGTAVWFWIQSSCSQIPWGNPTPRSSHGCWFSFGCFSSVLCRLTDRTLSKMHILSLAKSA